MKKPILINDWIVKTHKEYIMLPAGIRDMFSFADYVLLCSGNLNR